MLSATYTCSYAQTTFISRRLNGIYFTTINGTCYLYRYGQICFKYTDMRRASYTHIYKYILHIDTGRFGMNFVEPKNPSGGYKMIYEHMLYEHVGQAVTFCGKWWVY